MSNLDKSWTNHGPCQLFFGCGVINRVTEFVGLENVKNILVVCGQSAIQTGSAKKLINQFKNKNIKSELFSSISKDPCTADIRNIIDLDTKNNFDLLVAIGGGSTIDAAKAASVLIPEKLDIEDVLSGIKNFTSKVKVVAIPTTAGTGAELSRGAIINWESRGIKSGLRGDLIIPDYAIVDPELTLSVPKRQVAITGFDILTHAIETFISKKSTPITEIFSLKAIEKVVKNLPLALSNQYNIDAREELSLSSTLMGYNLANSSTCIPHRLQYPLGFLTETEHAYGLSILYPAWIKNTYEVSKNKFDLISDIMSRGMLIEDEGIFNSILCFLKIIGLVDSLSTLGLTKDDCDRMSMLVSGALGNDPWWDERKNINQIYYDSL